MPEETSERNIKQDVEIAVLAKEVEHLGIGIDSLKTSIGERIQSLTDIIKSFIDIVDKKVDRETYLADKKFYEGELSKVQTIVRVLDENYRIAQISNRATDEERKKIWGMSRGSVAFVIQLLTLITLVFAVVQIFSH